MEHFGVTIKGKSFKLTKDDFAPINTKPSLPYFASLAERNAYTDECGSTYNETWCIEYRELCLRNYDLNMDYFSTLDKAEFDKALESFFFQYKRFVEVKNLNDFKEIEGYYVMVLDEYKQVYIGKTKNIKRRIMQHWTKSMPLDRILFPMYAWDKSCFSINFFRALDTTRIFAWKRKLSDGIESKLIRSFPDQFCTNRIGGDITNAIQAIKTIKERGLQ